MTMSKLVNVLSSADTKGASLKESFGENSFEYALLLKSLEKEGYAVRITNNPNIEEAKYTLAKNWRVN